MGPEVGAGSATTSSRQKRKREKRLGRESRLKRLQSGSSYTSETHVRVMEGELAAIGAHTVPETVVDSLAGGRHEWQRNNFDNIQETGANSLTECESEMIANRVNYCLLLEALRDAIRGYRSLLEDRKVLHQDILENHIIIAEPALDGAAKGRLINLDLAKELESLPSGARHRTDTMQLTAIEVLEGKGHMYS
ncbi:serine threonine- kinase sgk2 protein [Rutstroemia sp. NJR-2017a BVV2]|nr:serine threonine- kinase sgk2 protein [Rutstroemia sp. NJR-2017a BVV2]